MTEMVYIKATDAQIRYMESVRDRALVEQWRALDRAVRLQQEQAPLLYRRLVETARENQAIALRMQSDITNGRFRLER